MHIIIRNDSKKNRIVVMLFKKIPRLGDFLSLVFADAINFHVYFAGIVHGFIILTIRYKINKRQAKKVGFLLFYVGAL